MNEEELVNEAISYLDGDVIEHYGVPGMKWGVRKQVKTGGGRGKRVKAKLKKLAGTSVSAIKGAHAAAKKAKHNRDLNRVRSKVLSGRKVSDKELSKITSKEVQEMVDLQNKRKILREGSKGKLQKAMEGIGDVLASSAKETAKTFLTKKGSDLVDKALKLGKYEEDTITDITKDVKSLGDKALAKAIERKKKEAEYKNFSLSNALETARKKDEYKNLTKPEKKAIQDLMQTFHSKPADLSDEEMARVKTYIQNLRYLNNYPTGKQKP